MTNNDVLRSLRYLLNINDKKLVEIFQLAGGEIPLVDVQSMLLKEDDSNYLNCEDSILALFLDGLIYLKRGKDPNRPPLPYEFPISNNTILKKLRVAFELKEEDMHHIFSQAQFQLGRHELTAFLRRPGHHNYRECGDQVLRYFLKGLTLRFRGS